MITTEADCFPATSQKFEFLEMKTPNVMLVRKHWNEHQMHCSQLGLLDVKLVDIDVLKKFEIWEQLTPEVQKQLENMTIEEKAAVSNLLEKARKEKRPKYPNVPRSLVCITCGEKVSVPPSVLVGRVEKIVEKMGSAYLMEDYVKAFQCQACHPTKGRKANPANSNIPKELVCACGAKVNTNATALRA